MANRMFSSGGSTEKTRQFLQKMQAPLTLDGIDALAQQGVNALASATPVDSGLTASSWSYKIEQDGSRITVSWLNSHVVDGVNVAIILQYGHGTGTGGYVQGLDYINPAIQPVFDRIAEDIWKRVTLA